MQKGHNPYLTDGERVKIMQHGYSAVAKFHISEASWAISHALQQSITFFPVIKCMTLIRWIINRGVLSVNGGDAA